MKILIDARLGWGSGIGRFMSNTIPIVVTNLREWKFDIIVLEGDVDHMMGLVEECSNVDVVSCSVEPFSLREQVWLPRFARNYDATWFTNYWVPLSFSGRYVATVHDLLHLKKEFFPAPRVKRFLSYLTFLKLAHSASGISFVSRFSRREFERRFGAQRLAIVQHNGIDHRGVVPFDPLAPPAKQRRLLAVGASKAHKNFAMLLQAWKEANVPAGWSLTIVSPGSDVRSSVELTEYCREVDRTEIRVRVTDQELRELYAVSSISLMPSFYEGFGIPFLEGLQSGTICITSTAEAMVEIGCGAFCIFVNPHDVEGWIAAIEYACRFIDEPPSWWPDAQRDNMKLALDYRWADVGQKVSELLKASLA